MAGLHKAGRTLLAHIGSFAGVYPLVYLDVCVLREGGATVWTGEGFLAPVGQSVSVQVTQAGESRLAQVTHTGALTSRVRCWAAVAGGRLTERVHG